MTLAYVYPLLGIFWTMLMFFGLVIVIWFILWCLIDNFRRRDHHGLAKALWAVVILFVPLLGAFVYVIARPPMADVGP